MVQITLQEIENWYKEPMPVIDRPRLLSKLATLELCGWIEEELDRILIALENPLLGDEDWVKSEIVSRNYGFDYGRHFRAMLCRLVGESVVRRTETEMERKHPGELAQLKSIFGSLWKKRCSFAHADVHANIRSQQTFDAPSITLSQFKKIAELLEHYEFVLFETALA